MKKLLYATLATAATLSSISAMANEHQPMRFHENNHHMGEMPKPEPRGVDRPHHPSSLTIIVDTVLREVLK